MFGLPVMFFEALVVFFSEVDYPAPAATESAAYAFKIKPGGRYGIGYGHGVLQGYGGSVDYAVESLQYLCNREGFVNNFTAHPCSFLEAWIVTVPADHYGRDVESFLFHVH